MKEPIKPADRPPTDYRARRKQEERRGLLVGILVLLLAGDVLVALLFGLGQALGALPWLVLGGAALAGLFFLWEAIEGWLGP
jgi:hypothetical protein